MRGLGANLDAIIESEKDGALLLLVCVFENKCNSHCAATVVRISLFLKSTENVGVSGVPYSVYVNGIVGGKWIGKL